jgi:hypothetical protein
MSHAGIASLLPYGRELGDATAPGDADSLLAPRNVPPLLLLTILLLLGGLRVVWLCVDEIARGDRGYVALLCCGLCTDSGGFAGMESGASVRARLDEDNGGCKKCWGGLEGGWRTRSECGLCGADV